MSPDSRERTAPAFANAPKGPWTLALRLVEIREGLPGWRIQNESPNYERGPITVMTYRDYQEAFDKFQGFKAGIDLEITEDAERKVLCSRCKKELSADFRPFFDIMPHRPHDLAYCGCGGWD